MRTIKLLLLTLVAISSQLFAQNAPVDFEPAGNGDSWAWTVAENGTNPALEFVVNPSKLAPNTSDNVAKFTALGTGQPWALFLTSDIGTFSFSSSNSLVKLMVYKTKVSDVGLKFEGAGPATEIKVANTKINEWEELEFDFSAIEGQSYSTLVIIPDFDFTPRGTDAIVLLDNMTFNANSTPPPPAPSAAPTAPTQDAAKVISIFSDTYTDVAGTDFNPNWGQATVLTTVDLSGNAVLKMANLNYQGCNFGSDVNAAAMEFLHVDVWTADETSLNVYPISRSTGEQAYNLTPLTTETWNSFDIPLSYFTDLGMTMADLFQYKFVGSGGKTVYLDNIYFWDNSAADVEAPTAFTATLGTVTNESVEFLLNATDNSGAVNYEITYGATTVTTGGASGVEKSYVVSSLTASTAYSFSVIAKDASDNAAANNPITLNTTTLAALPASPTPPPYNSALVTSVFSDAFTDIEGTIFNPNWGQSTVVTTENVGGNDALKYTNLNYQGIVLGSDIDATNKMFLRVDVYTANETSLDIYCISRSNGEKAVNLTPLSLNQWNSYDIPVSAFTSQGLTVSDLKEFKFVGSGGKTVYIDNLYFLEDYQTEVSEVKKANVIMYPNPASALVTIQSNLEVSHIEVINLAGKVISHLSINELNPVLDISNYTQGTYFVKVSFANGSQSVQKLIKQ